MTLEQEQVKYQLGMYFNVHKWTFLGSPDGAGQFRENALLTKRHIQRNSVLRLNQIRCTLYGRQKSPNEGLRVIEWVK